MYIGLDFDGVIADGARLKSAVLKQRFGIDIPPSHCKRAIALQEGLVSEEVYEKTLRIVYEDPAVHELMPPIPGAIETIHRWLAYGHRVRIITARDPLAERNVLPWLSRHHLPLAVTCVGRFMYKTKACQGLDAYADDDLTQLVALKTTVARTFLFGPQPDRTPTWLPYGIKRVASWKELSSRFRRPARVA